MITKQNIQQYGLCVKCNVNMAKLSSNCCKKCKVKPIKPKTVKKKEAYKVYFYKFQSKDNTAKILINTPPNEIGYSIYSEPSSPSTRGFQPIKNSELFFQTTWDQFRSLKEFTACIIHSDQISIGFFIISCGTLIQTLPKYQQFIKNKVIDLPSEILIENSNLPYPITSSAQLICQDSFWENQLHTYFKEFHVKIPLFSISTFDKKLTSPSLLSAMYYGGYIFSKCHETEVWDYMKKFATQNIKRIIKKTTIDNLRALIIHIHISQWIGDLNLSKSLQSHATRMSYMLGLHLNSKNLPLRDCYNRSLLFCAVKTINIGFSGSQNCSTSYLTELGTENPNLYDPGWQLPIQSSPNYSENELENQIYALSLVEYFKFIDLLIKAMWFPSFYNLETNTFNNIWNSKVSELKEIYSSSMLAFENMKQNYADFQDKVESYETQLKLTYQEAMIEMYELLKHRNKCLQPCEVSSILDHCHIMYQIFSSKNDSSPVANFFANIIGMHYLNTYPKCTPDEKVRTKQRLQDLILYIKNSFYSYFSLNYLILKTGYDLLDD